MPPTAIFKKIPEAYEKSKQKHRVSTPKGQIVDPGREIEKHIWRHLPFKDRNIFPDFVLGAKYLYNILGGGVNFVSGFEEKVIELHLFRSIYIFYYFRVHGNS